MIAEGYKDTEIGVIPVEWDVVKLGSLGTTYNGLSGKTKEDFGSGSPYITYMNVFSNNSIDTNIVEYVNINSNEKQNKVQNGDIFFTVSSETKDEVGMTSVLLEDFENDTYINSFCFGFRLNNNEKLLSRFAKFLLREHNTRKRITFYGAGTTRINISKVKLMDLLLQLPPLKEQEKIADILSTVDDKIDAIQKQIDRAETLKKGLLQKLLSEGIEHSEFKDSELGKIPRSWEIGKLEDISDFITKGATPTTYGFDWEEIGIPFLRSECVSDNGLVMKAAMFISAEAHKHMNRSEIKNGDLLMTITGNVGRVILLQDVISIGNINQHIARIRISSNQVDNKFIYQYLSQDKYRLNYYKITTGQAYPQISLKQVRNSIVPLPPLEEQKQIAEILSTTDKKLKVLKAKKEKYETLKKGLLQKLLSGEVRV